MPERKKRAGKKVSKAQGTRSKRVPKGKVSQPSDQGTGESGGDRARRTRLRVASSTRSVALESVARIRDLPRQAREAIQPEWDRFPYLSLVRAPVLPMKVPIMGPEITVASYNVHRWTGLNGRARPEPERATAVISEIEADVIALQEVLRPSEAEDPLDVLCDGLGFHLAFAPTRRHRRGELGNAILSRYPMTSISVLDISYSRIERRVALAARFEGPGGGLGVVATHLSLVDRTRHRQVQQLLEHPQLNAGPSVLIGDMNAWRQCKASQNLEDSLKQHNNFDWPATFPAARPLLALDRIYARKADVISIESHDTRASRRASDHLPVVARIQVSKDENDLRSTSDPLAAHG